MKRVGPTAKLPRKAAATATTLKPSGGHADALTLALLALAVAIIVLIVHRGVLSAQASSFDDEEAIVRNVLVQHPSVASVKRFFSEVLLSSVVRGYYRPLTLTSLMLDWAMGGRPNDYYAFHCTSLALHIGSTLLLMLLVYQVFRNPAVAAMAGVLFGVHPLTVEPIAWVMERKTVLAAFFAFACLNAYVRFAVVKGMRWYVIALTCYLLSLLAKPTGTPLPLMLLLMDYWPLKRLQSADGIPRAFGLQPADSTGKTPVLYALVEKIPFFLLSAIFALLCMLCENRVNPLTMPAKLSPLYLPLRLCWLIVFYPCKILLPIHLSSVYMPPDPLAMTNPIVLASIAGVILLFAALAISRRWTPAGWVGAAIFYIGLAPTMGFVGYSWVVASDKYTYLPAAGLILVLGALLNMLWSRGRDAIALHRHRLATVAGVLVAAILLSLGTRHYIRQWKNTQTLYGYMLDLAPNSAHVNYAVGYAYFQEGKPAEALAYYRKARKMKSEIAPAGAEHSMGVMLTALGQIREAIDCYERALDSKPDYPDALNNLAWLLAVHDFPTPPTKRDPILMADQACQQTRYLNPYLLDTLAVAYASAGRFPQAIKTAREAIRLADAAGEQKLSEQISRRLELYQASRPYREPLPTTRNGLSG